MKGVNQQNKSVVDAFLFSANHFLRLADDGLGYSLHATDVYIRAQLLWDRLPESQRNELQKQHPRLRGLFKYYGTQHEN